MPIEDGAVEAEHRQVTAAFVKFSGTDTLVEDLDGAAAALGELADVVSSETEERAITWLESDIDRDGGKLYLVAGAPASERRRRGADAARDAGDRRRGRRPADRGRRQPRSRARRDRSARRRRRTYAVMGDTVNLAARLTARAAKGEILATGDVLQRSRAQFETQARASS